MPSQWASQPSRLFSTAKPVSGTAASMKRSFPQCMCVRLSADMYVVGPIVGALTGVGAFTLWEISKPADGSSLADRLLSEFEKFNDRSRDVCFIHHFVNAIVDIPGHW